MIITAIEMLEPDDRDFMLRVYERHKALMYRTVKKLNITHPAIEDVVQDAIIRLIPKVKTLRTLNPHKLCAYVVYTTKNTAKNHLRNNEVKEKHVKFDDGELDEMVCPSLTPEEAVLIGEEQAAFLEIWNELSSDEQDLLSGKYLLDLSNAELAKQFKCKPGSVRMKLTRARRNAYEHIKNKESDYVER